MTSRDVPEKGRVSVHLCLQSRLPFLVAQVLGGRLAAGTWVSAVSALGAWGYVWRPLLCPVNMGWPVADVGGFEWA